MGTPAAEASRAPSWIYAVASGVLLGLSQPVVLEWLGDEPIDRTGWTGALALVGFVPVLLALRGTTPRRGWWLGFIASFVQFTIQVQWLVVAMVVFGRIPVIVSWVILALLTATMAAYVASAYAITRVLVGRFGWAQWLVFPVALTGVEFCRNVGPLGGFPWGNVGTSFATVPLLLQPAALFGVHGLILCAAFVSSCCAEVVRARGRALPWRPLVAGTVMLAAWLAFGVARLATDPGVDVETPAVATMGSAAPPSVRIGLLQGNIEQGIRNTVPWTGRTILNRYRALQNEAVAEGAQIVVWPEASFPLRLRRDVADLTDDYFVEDGLEPPAAVVGAVGYEPTVEDGIPVEVRSNSAFIVGPAQRVLARVDKAHLVPFGEYVPWPFNVLVEQIVPIGGTRPGTGYKAVGIDVTLSDGTRRELKVGTTICYEGIFPEITRTLRLAGAELHVNVTNDGWYGISAAATQHLAFYALRAVESGMPVVRAANTGKSGWADTRGRLHDVTAIYTHGAVVADVPVATTTTLYVLWGEWVALPCALWTVGAWIAALIGADAWRRRRTRLDTALAFLGFFAAAAAIAAFLVTPSIRASEGDVTRTQLTVVAGLLVAVGALAGRPWGRKAHMAVGVLGVVFGVASPLLGGPGLSFTLAAAGAALWIVARRRKTAYERPPDPLVHDDG